MLGATCARELQGQDFEDDKDDKLRRQQEQNKAAQQRYRYRCARAQVVKTRRARLPACRQPPAVMRGASAMLRRRGRAAQQPPRQVTSGARLDGATRAWCA
jgi:hypothetical protein